MVHLSFYFYKKKDASGNYHSTNQHGTDKFVTENSVLSIAERPHRQGEGDLKSQNYIISSFLFPKKKLCLGVCLLT